MEFRDAMKELRRELDVTQAEIASALHINTLTVSRWERGKSLPNPSLISLLMGYAYTHSAPKHIIEQLRSSSNITMKQKNKQVNNRLFSVEYSTLAHLIDDITVPIYICDTLDNSMLYVNKKAGEMFLLSPDSVAEQKCYSCIMERNTPCENCRQQKPLGDSFECLDSVRLPDGKTYHVYGRAIRWNAHDAQARYLLEAIPDKTE